MGSSNEVDNKIYIRADGNDVIATGHIMRCLSIAEQIRKLGVEVRFVTADDSPCSLIEDRGFFVDVLGTVWNDLDKEMDVIGKYIEEKNVSTILVDSYYVTEKYLSFLSRKTKVAYIDDIYAFAYPVNTLINYAVFADMNAYHELYGERGEPKYLIGGEYVPIREEFLNVDFSVKTDVNKVMITTGGTDRLNVTGNLLKAVLCDDKLNKLYYHIIVGKFNKNKSMLETAAAASNGHIILHENVTKMSAYMTECDLAVSAAGSTLYELCSCGTPTICLEIADNQKGAYMWERKGLMRYAGNAAKNLDGCINEFLVHLRELMTDYDTRLEMSHRMKKIVDGRGAERIAGYLIDTIS